MPLLKPCMQKKKGLNEELKTTLTTRKEKSDAIWEESRKRRDNFKIDQEKKWKEKQAKQQAEYEQRQKQRQQREEERKQRQEEREAGEALKDPFEDEIAMCDQLVLYLQGLLPKPVPQETSNPAASGKQPPKKKKEKPTITHPLEILLF